MKRRLLLGTLVGTLCAALVPGIATAGSDVARVEISCDGKLAITAAGVKRGWANKTFAGYRRTCETGTLLIWNDWTTDEPSTSRSF